MASFKGSPPMQAGHEDGTGCFPRALTLSTGLRLCGGMQTLRTPSWPGIKGWETTIVWTSNLELRQASIIAYGSGQGSIACSNWRVLNRQCIFHRTQKCAGMVAASSVNAPPGRPALQWVSKPFLVWESWGSLDLRHARGLLYKDGNMIGWIFAALSLIKLIMYSLFQWYSACSTNWKCGLETHLDNCQKRGSMIFTNSEGSMTSNFF